MVMVEPPEMIRPDLKFWRNARPMATGLKPGW
jgi:hypothetical protein